MSYVLYSVYCHINDQHYRFYISVGKNDDNSTGTLLPENSDEFTSTEISTHGVIPSLTQLNFESTELIQTMVIPEKISLNNLLKVEKTSVASRSVQQQFSNNSTMVTTTVRTKPLTTNIPKSHSRVFGRSISDMGIQRENRISRQTSLKKFLSKMSSSHSKTDCTTRAVVKISYIDVSNSYWKIKRLELEVESDEVANELCTNLDNCLSTLKQRPHHLLVFINPSAGRGKSNRKFSQEFL